MTNQQAIDIIKSNWPDERYAILKDALTLALIALSDSKEWRVPNKTTPDGAPLWALSKYDVVKLDGWVLWRWRGVFPDEYHVVLAKENQGPPPEDYQP